MPYLSLFASLPVTMLEKAQFNLLPSEEVSTWRLIQKLKVESSRCNFRLLHQLGEPEGAEVKCLTSLFNNDHHCCCNINIVTQRFDSKKERTIMGQSRPSTIPTSSSWSWSSSGSGGQAAAAPSRGIKFGNWVEELHYTQHPEEVVSQCVCVLGAL